MKILASFSGGKDSTLSLDRVIDKGYTPVGLVITTNRDGNSWFHDVREDVLEAISQSLEIPIFFCPCRSGNEYTEDFEKALKQIIALTGAKGFVFGDIDIEEHRQWCEKIAGNLKLETIFPLWQEDREKLVMEFIEKGYKTVIKKVNKHCLTSSYLGRTLDKDLLEEFKTLGIDVAGENGEYHTLVYGGPKFTKTLSLRFGRITEDENCFCRDMEVVDLI